MSVNYGFKVCRVCLSPEPAVKLRSMFEGRGEIADWFQLVSGCSISYDRSKHEALICPKCSVEVKTAFDLRENIRRVDVYYFQARREEADGYNEDFERDQTAVEDPAEKVSQSEVNNASSGSASASGAGASRKPRPVEGGVTKMESFARVAKTIPGKSFKCHVCDKILANKFTLLLHIESVHEKIKNFSCDLCPMKCSMKANLQRHIRRMHMSPAPHLKCDFKNCKKFFRTSSALYEHEKIHLNERPYLCPTCLKSYKTKHDLHVHQKRHSAERFCCSACKQAFKTSKDRNSHQKKCLA